MKMYKALWAFEAFLYWVLFNFGFFSLQCPQAALQGAQRILFEAVRA
ncbi:MAG: hypothetical protein JW811_01985 [Clostridiales bacterium]|nr:hypothetical protein [Clostridiales bacterium]